MALLGASIALFAYTKIMVKPVKSFLKIVPVLNCKMQEHISHHCKLRKDL